MLIGIGLFGIVLLCIGIVIAKKVLKMKEQGKENFKLYVIGCTIAFVGTILFILCLVELLLILFN